MNLRSLLAAPALLATVFSGGCNFIFNPANSDDIVRCKNTIECEKEEVFFDALNTERVDAQCAAPGGSATFGTSKTNQVCALVDKASVSCGIEMLPKGDFADAVDAATTNKGVYAPCAADKLGTLGCKPLGNGSCSGGLTKNKHGVCDDKKGLLYAQLEASDPDYFLQDVKDQQCRSYFCSDQFVCDEKSKCIRCDPAKEPGKGGCGDLALNGARSTVYQSETELEMNCPDSSTFEGTMFGAVVPDPNL